MPTGIYTRSEEEKKRLKQSVLINGKNTRFKKGLSNQEFYPKAIKTRKETALKKGYYHSDETKNKIGEKNKISLNGHKVKPESIIKRTETRRKNGWYKDREKTLNKISGKNSKMWLGGQRKKDYGTEFNNELKRKVIERDKRICQICGILLKGNIHPHHIDYDKKNNRKDNLITLCNSCHSKTNHNRRGWLDLLYCFLSYKENKTEKWDYVNKPLEVIYG